ncbi:MAG TPA: nucleotidyltransferase family protein [Lamprocystis sp. (in: g-proteobacteria)]|nr:nucleotidyltransferase family protein [Lamprocystis sp. (in: g-proteobacteria)]
MTDADHSDPGRSPSDALLLAPFRVDPDLHRLASAPRWDSERLLHQIIAQGLAPLWSEWAGQSDFGCTLPADLRARLKGERRDAAGRYLLQRRTATRASASLTKAGVGCAFFKGAAVRERLYPQPSDRPAADLDLLVAPKERDRAVRVLCAAGFALQGIPDTVSHEISLLDSHASVDLHWGLFRPGRARFDLTPALLHTTRLEHGLPLVSDNANLLVLLVHPAFAKHVNGRAAKLIRVVDLDRILRTIEPDWDWILHLIDAAGLRTAAWAVLHWTRTLMDTPVDPTVLRHLAPGRFQSRYLAYWIDHQLPARLGGVPGLVQGAFTLALHDRAGDAGRAVLELGKARLESGRILKHLQQIAVSPGES